MRSLLPLLALALTASLQAQTPTADSLGEMLYSSHCVECHTQQVHWRDKRLARNWDTLKVQVRHWNDEARLPWTEEEVEAVAKYLNDTIYRFPQPQARR